MFNLFSMLLVVIKRLWHNVGLTASTLVGVLGVLTIVVCVPVFSYAVSGELLRQQLLEQAATTGRPLFCMHIYYWDFDKPLFDMDLSQAVHQ